MIENVLKLIEQALELANQKGAYTLKEAALISQKAEELKVEFERLQKVEAVYRSEREAHKDSPQTLKEKK